MHGRWRLFSCGVVLGGCLALLQPAVALRRDGLPDFINELRLGISLFAEARDDRRDGKLFVHAEALSPDIPGEYDNALAEFLLTPRVHLGLAADTGSGTDKIYAGLSWTWDIHTRLFLEVSLGGAIHNGALRATRVGHGSLGSRLLFHERLALGLRLTPSVSALAFVDHASNAGLASENDGLTQAGVLLGYVF